MPNGYEFALSLLPASVLLVLADGSLTDPGPDLTCWPP